MLAIDSSPKTPTNESYDHSPLEGRAMSGERNSVPDSERRSITPSTLSSRQFARSTLENGGLDRVASGDSITPHLARNIDEDTKLSADSSPFRPTHCTKHGNLGDTRSADDGADIQYKTPTAPSEDGTDTSNNFPGNGIKPDLGSIDESLKNLPPTFSSFPMTESKSPSYPPDEPFGGNYANRPMTSRTVPGSAPVPKRGDMAHLIPEQPYERAGLDSEASDEDEALDDAEYSELGKMLKRAIELLAGSKKSKGRD